MDSYAASINNPVRRQMRMVHRNCCIGDESGSQEKDPVVDSKLGACFQVPP